VSIQEFSCLLAPRRRSTGSFGLAIFFVITMVLAYGLPREAASAVVPVDGFVASSPEDAVDALRLQVAHEEWLRVRVDLRRPESAAAEETAAPSAEVEYQLERTVQDLLFDLPIGSFAEVQRDAGASALTLLVDAAGLDALLDSPWVEAVAVGEVRAMARIEAGISHSLAIKPDGSLWGWGRNDFGQLGDGTTKNRLTPVRIMGGVAAVMAGRTHSAALTTNGTLWVWGDNASGQLGDGTTTRHLKPVRIMDGVAAVAGGVFHTLALKNNGELWAWGGISGPRSGMARPKLG
jgi:hypothetical protein